MHVYTYIIAAMVVHVHMENLWTTFTLLGMLKPPHTPPSHILDNVPNKYKIYILNRIFGVIVIDILLSYPR